MTTTNEAKPKSGGPTWVYIAIGVAIAVILVMVAMGTQSRKVDELAPSFEPPAKVTITVEPSN